ncbi:hypothetical protein [cf. Phormidesmis sp. LEGE 11477]|uniref:hypothetical protein n=1 Tax=cf. Phormidesmis sp. LEGE 11477 TaxID=1828680 RepID=UPI00187F389D|nr:hypothetical protein [cf. Phormidesmis sp. LEGE 11477]MBE9062566.1 hypothetical protein [cf. Phormidesmis sp. LEGE 11477]
MQLVRTLKSCSPLVIMAALLSLPLSVPSASEALSLERIRNKTAGGRGELIESLVDCDGDGLNNESQIDFDGDGVPDECVDGAENIPEPPFEQSYTPTSEEFYSQLPTVGWSASYECADGLYEVQLSRPAADKIAYSAQGLKLTGNIVYDDLDPNLNAPLLIKEPTSGIRYSFTQLQGDEFYEYAITNYNGDIGLYIYQTGEQILAAPCTVLPGE